MALRLKTVAAPQGIQWVRAGFRLFARRPMAFSTLLLAFFFASLMVSVLLPLVGSVVSLMALPLLTMGYMIATRSALGGGLVHPGQLIEPLRTPGPQRKRLLQLCALYGGLTLLVLLGADLVMGDAGERLRQVFTGEEVTPEEAGAIADDPRLLQGLALQAALITLLSVPFWHAPALVVWGDQGVAQALFSSTLAVWRCRGAFALYGLVWAGLVLGLGTLAALLFSLIGLPQMAPVAAVPIALMCMTVFYVTLYFTFVDSFETEAPRLTEGPAGP
ncbi:MAG: BPSS1780 family membrane protein [Pseudomonadota bacterium]